jgi:hypothetical protein
MSGQVTWPTWGALLQRYQHSGDTVSLNQAVECARQAVSSIDAGYRQRPRMLDTLALALRTRFQRRGDRPDIDAAVDAIEEAVQATEAGHPDEARHLSALSTALRVRFAASTRKKIFTHLRLQAQSA